MESENLKGPPESSSAGWFARISIRVKLTLAFGLILVLFLTTALQTYDNYQKVVAARVEIVRSLKIILLVNELYTLTYSRVVKARSGATELKVVTGANAAIPGLDELDQHLNDLESLTAGDRIGQQRVQELRQVLNDWRTQTVGGRQDPAAEARVLQGVHALRLDLQQYQQTRLGQQEAAQEQQSKWLQLELIVMLLAGLTVGISAMLYSGRRLSDPLVALSWQMREVAVGRTGIRIREQGRGDEIGTVARALEVFRQARVASDLEAGNKARLLLELRIANEELEVSANELMRASQYKSEFMATVSHELRTPLTSIRGSLGLIAGGAAGVLPPQARSLLTIAQNNTDRLLALIDDLLDVEKIEAGKMELERVPVDPVALVESALVANQGYADKFKVSYVFKPPPADQISLTGDARRLSQVLANLLSNAAKYAPEGSPIEVAVVASEARVRVSVRDRGPGIPAEFRSRIFQKFSQADSSDRRQKGGTGLGLAICKAIIEQHRGQIGFESTPGDTHFWFELPLHKPSRRHARARVLVVENDADTAALLSSLLKKVRYDPNIANDVADAKRLLAERSYELLLLGRLPSGEDGFALLSDVRGNPVWGGLQVMVVSKRAEDANKILDSAVRLMGWLGPAAGDDRERRGLRNRLANPQGEADRPRILHVEDDPDLIAMMRAQFGNKVELLSVTNVTDARTLLEKQSFNLVILDLMLPDGSGYELLPFLHARTPATPVVIFSAHDAKPYATRQVAAVLAKSGDHGQDLVDLVRTVLGSGGGA